MDVFWHISPVQHPTGIIIVISLCLEGKCRFVWAPLSLITAVEAPLEVLYSCFKKFPFLGVLTDLLHDTALAKPWNAFWCFEVTSHWSDVLVTSVIVRRGPILSTYALSGCSKALKYSLKNNISFHLFFFFPNTFGKKPRLHMCITKIKLDH